MTPPKTPSSDLSFLDWAPGQDTAPAVKADPNSCSNCHTEPKPTSPYALKNGNPFFLDYARKPKPPLNAQEEALLRAWIAGEKAPAAPATDNPPPAAKPAPVKPVAPGDAATLEEHAKELERQARLTLDPEKKLAFYQSALAFHLLSGDAKASTAVLDQLEAGYKKSNHEAGQKFVAATRLWVDGKTDEALKALADMDKLAQGAGWAFSQQYAAQRSLLLQSVAGEKLRQKDYAGAKELLKQALVLTPSDQLTAKVLKLMAEHGEADLKKQAADIAALQSQRDQLAMPPVRCNANCHGANNDKPDFSDFDYAPLLMDQGGKPLRRGPDLSAYRKLTHLSYQEKVRLHDLDEKLKAAREQHLSSMQEIRTLVFTKTLDDPKKPLDEIEAGFLQGATAFTGPDRALPWALAGEAYLAKKDYEKAVAALEASVKEDPSQINAQFSLGQSRFATGDFQGSRDAYTAILARQPQDVMATRYRADANSEYLKTLDPKTQADDIAKVEDELASDRAMLLARYNANEKDKVKKLGEALDQLRSGDGVSLETRQETVNMMELMAKQYLALAETPQAGPVETELVRKELNGLAAQTFDLLAKFAKEDADPEIKKRAGLYQGYSHLAKGEIDEATKAFEPFRKDLPEIDKILRILEKNKLRMVNLAALDAWAVYNKEGAAVQADAQNGILGDVIGGIESWGRDDGKDFRDDTKARWKGQVAFVAELRSRIESGKADTILQAMEQIQKDGPESMKADATYYIDYRDAAITGYPLGALVHLVDKLPPEKGEAEELMHKTWDLERQNPAVETPYAFYTLVNFLDKEASWQGTAREGMDALEGKGSFGRSAFKFITSMSPESVAIDVLLMAASAGLGNLAKLSALSKLEKAGVTGYKAIFLAGAVGVGVEGTALWAANLGKEAMLRDTSKVFTAEHMLKSYGATLIMIGGLKGVGKLSEGLAPRAAKSLGLVTEGGTKLTTGGKLLTWGIGHGAGLGGMIATSHINQAAGLTPKPVGGWKEGLVHDVFGYVQFAAAHKFADAAFGGKLSTISNKQHNEIAVREAILSAKSYADAMGFRATTGPKGEIVDSPERKLIVGLLVDAGLNKIGFSGGKLAKLVESRKFDLANDFLAEFNLPLEYNKSGQLIAVARGEASPHAAAGIPAGKPKKAVPLKQKANDVLDKAAAWLFEPGDGTSWVDRAAAWLFGPPGGGAGGLQPAYAGAYGAGKVRAPKEAPKGPDVMMMADGNGWGGGAHKALEKFETALVEKDIFDLTHNGNEAQNPSGVRVGIGKKENLNDVAAALKGEIPAELKSVQVTVGEAVSLADLAGLIQAAKAKGVDLLIFDGSSAEQPAYRLVGGRFLVPDEAGAKTLLTEALKHGQDIEIAYGKDSKTLAKVSGDKIELNFKAKDKAQQAELVEGILSGAIKGGRNVTVAGADGQSFTVKTSGGRIEVKSSGGESLTYAPASGSTRAKLEIQLPKGADADRAAVLLRVAAELEPKQLNGARVAVEGLDLSLGGPVKANLSLLIQKSLWGEVSSLQIGSGKDIYLESGLKGSSLAYSFSTKLGFEQGNAYLAEYLAFESAKALGASGPADAKTALMQRYYRAASRQALELHQNAKPPKGAEYASYVGADYVKVWTGLTETMAKFAANPKQQKQLSELLDKVRDYSQREKNDFLGFKPFDGKSFADNAFELSRLFDGARSDSSIDLPRAFRDAMSLFGTQGKVEVYGAGLGIVYKMYVQGDKAALNEYQRFQTMKDEAVKSGDGYRFSIVPEDRSQGAHYGSDKFTKTPEWIVEKLDASGNTTQMTAVEVTNRDGSLVSAPEIDKMIGEKVFQITGHEFNKTQNQGDGLIIVRLYKAAGREDALTQMVMDGLRTEYRTNSSKAKAKEKIRVMVILEDPSFPGGAKTRWLDYDRGGNWKQREASGAREAPGNAWAEPFYQAMGW